MTAPTTQTARPSRKKAILLLSAAVAAAAVVSTALLWPSVPEGQHNSGISALAPADSDTLIVAPFSEKWWSDVAAFDNPGKGLLSVDPTTAPAGISAIGYSRSSEITHPEGMLPEPQRLFYIETESSEDADNASKWLEGEGGGSNFKVHRQDNTLVLTPVWVTDYQKPVETVSELEGYSPKVSTNQGTMWVNPDMEITSLSSKKNAEPYDKILRKALGYKPGTTWQGSSTDGASWAGDFVTGGVSKDLLNADAARTVFSSTETVLGKAQDATTKAEIIDRGLGGILDSASIAIGSETLGDSVPSGASTGVDNPLVSVVNNVSAWNNALRGISGAPEPLDTRYLSANEKSMVITYTSSAKN